MSVPADTETTKAPAAGDAAARPGKRPGRALARWVALGVLCVLVSVLLVVVFVLPDIVAERGAPELPPAAGPAEEASAPPPTPPAELRRAAREKREAEKLLGDVLQKQTELEARGIARWGGADYEAALDRLAAGDVHFQEQRFAAAAGAYRDTGERLERLEQSMPVRLEAALAAGERALAERRGEDARREFAVALAIDPDDDRARRGLARAERVEEVAALLAAGRAREDAGELEAAAAKYEAAVALDPDAADARAALARVTQAIVARDFQAAMSRALSAIDGGDHAAAEESLRRAAALMPGAPEVADARARLRTAREQRRIASHRARARALADEERWSQAAEEYAAVLAIDPRASFAETGRRRAAERARLHAEIDDYLADPGRLASPGPREGARRLLSVGEASVDAEQPALTAKLRSLRRVLEEAERPLPVRLRSDNATDVVVYRVGRFGKFFERELALPPGRYVAVGSRPGFRDARVEFEVAAGEAPPPVTIRCEERI